MRWLSVLFALILITAGSCTEGTVPASVPPADHVVLLPVPDDIPGIHDLPEWEPVLPNWDRTGVPPPQTEEPSGPVIAIIIDDMGFDTDGGRLLLDLNYPLTFAFLPLAPKAEEHALQAAERGYEIIVHLPMEPVLRATSDGGYWRPDPGPGAIRSGMEPEEISALVKAHYEVIPGAIGANNHMGSAATADIDVMTAVLRAVQEQGGLFVDSMTTPASAGRTAARTEGIRFAASDMFLDNLIDVDSIAHQLRLLGELALRNGSAIAIGHPHVATAQALERMLPELEQAGIRVVGISNLVAVPNGGGNDD